ncbi:hypothetical protein QOZ80_8AG0621170 [Eleusine coracana subsp. coracana]|nr:hypothetical protein QOZ80_8AG0621170 [Eleusine coracana subsp. coracana]
MKNAVVEMKWLDWDHMKTRKHPLLDQVLAACEHHGLKTFLTFQYSWNRKIIAQFYSTVYFYEDAKTMSWMTNGTKYTCSQNQFAGMIGLKHTRKERHKVQKGNHMDADDMRYMYVNPDTCSPPNSNGLKPFFSVLFRICRSTIAPRGGNSDRISAYQRDILHWVHGNRKFDVFDYVFREMWDISISPKRGCGYTPHIMFMIEKVSGLTFTKDMKHLSLKPQIPSNWTPDTTSGQFFRAAQPPSSAAPPQPPRAAPRGTGSSHVPPPPHGKRSGIMKMFKSLMSICRSINQRLDVIERNQRGLYDHFGIETPPPPSPAEGSPPPTHDDPASQDDPTFTVEEMNYFGYYPTPPPFSSGTGLSAQHIHFKDDDDEGGEDEAAHTLRQCKGKEPAIDEEEEEEDDDDDEDYEFSDD